MRILSIVAVAVAGSGTCFAQKASADSFMVINNFVPTIADAYKIGENPVSVDSVLRKAPMSYSISPKVVNTSFSVEPIKPAVMAGEPLTKLYRSLLKGGFGTYTSTYGEYFFNNLRSKELNWGMHLKHFSSTATLEDVGFSGYSDNVASIYGKKFLRKHTLWGETDYTRNLLHYYGYDAAQNSISDKAITRQIYSFIAPRAGLISHYTDSSKTNYDISMGYSRLADLYEAVEDNVNAKALFRTYVEQQLLKVGAEIDYYHNKNKLDTLSNTILNLSPSFIATGQKWRTSLGVTLTADVNKGNSQFHFYPCIDFNYDIIDNVLVPYAGITGGLKKNSLKSLTDENPFLETNIKTENTSKTFDVYGGIRGTVGSSVFYNAGISYAAYTDMAFFTTDFAAPILDNKFILVYDNVKLTTLRGDLQYQANEKLKLLARGELFKYHTTGIVSQVWHKPNMQLTFSGNYNLKDKIVLKADVFVFGKQRAQAPGTGGTIIAQELKAITDANLGLEYRYTKRLSAWVNFNNLTAQRYQRWYNYPSQKINILFGMSYAF